MGRNQMVQVTADVPVTVFEREVTTRMVLNSSVQDVWEMKWFFMNYDVLHARARTIAKRSWHGNQSTATEQSLKFVQGRLWLPERIVKSWMRPYASTLARVVGTHIDKCYEYSYVTEGAVVFRQRKLTELKLAVVDGMITNHVLNTDWNF